MATPREEHPAENQIEILLPLFPFYVQEYIRAKRRYGSTPSTLLEYLYDFRIFFEWLIKEGLADAKAASSVSYTILATLRK